MGAQVSKFSQRARLSSNGSLAPSSPQQQAQPSPNPSHATVSSRTERKERHVSNMTSGSGSSPAGHDPLLRYFLPAQPGEVTEGSRLTMQQYYLLKQSFKTNFMGITPDGLAAGSRVLDAGTATGLWLAEMERDFPASKYFAVDLTVNLWPDTELMNSSRSVNVVESHSLGRLPFNDGSFDYVHEQTQLYITSQDNWPHVINEFARVLKPGGYVDIVELDPFPVIAPTPLVAGFLSRLLPQMLSTGFDLRGASRVADFVEASGQFTDVQVIRRTAAMGWDGRLSELWLLHLKEGYLGLRNAFSFAIRPNMTAPPSEQEYARFMDAFFEDCANGQAYCNAFRVTARKK
ncbi:S-adenosyl-L-methionine-dependent methyltransferase [Cladochytrium replicatum]|nr:S-adenosyl-L-methionine-dependent methyltransferase [Cladochytrium replicatum]